MYCKISGRDKRMQSDKSQPWTQLNDFSNSFCTLFNYFMYVKCLAIQITGGYKSISIL